MLLLCAFSIEALMLVFGLYVYAWAFEINHLFAICSFSNVQILAVFCAHSMGVATPAERVDACIRTRKIMQVLN